MILRGICSRLVFRCLFHANSSRTPAWILNFLVGWIFYGDRMWLEESACQWRSLPGAASGSARMQRVVRISRRGNRSRARTRRLKSALRRNAPAVKVGSIPCHSGSASINVHLRFHCFFQVERRLVMGWVSARTWADETSTLLTSSRCVRGRCRRGRRW